MNEVKEFLRFHPLLFDGAMTTYKEDRSSAEVLERYMDAGADAIKTATFQVSRLFSQNEQLARKVLLEEIDAARSVLRDGVFLFADIGPVSQEVDPFPLFQSQIDLFLARGIVNFIFETMSDEEGLKEACAYIKRKCPDSFVIVSFAIESTGDGMQSLYDAMKDSMADAVGFNCHSGPRHMVGHVKKLKRCEKPLFIAPNAGYPTVLGWRVHYEGSPSYFASAMEEIRKMGCEIVGGCCGTTPEHIRHVRQVLDRLPDHIDSEHETKEKKEKSPVCMDWKDKVFVELDPPKNDQVGSFMRGVHAYYKAGADVITIADSPIGRPRADSSLLACRIFSQTGMTPLPHITCRDRNLNAIKALLMGLSSEGVHQVLFVTGDPLPQDSKEEVKAVYNFNSRKLMRMVGEMEELSQGMAMFGALDVNAVNFDQQLILAKEKEKNGAIGFLSQPILSKRALNNLKKAREQLQGFLFAGIYPIVSYKNALFLENEIHGMHIDPMLIESYKGLDRQQCEQLSKKVCVHIMKECLFWCDGFYLMTPFQRISLMEQLIKEARKIVDARGSSS